MFWGPKPGFGVTNTAPLTRPIRSYRDLRVWQQSMELVEATYRVTKSFPDTERYGLVNQLRRAAVSVASNIAEGHARSTGDYVRHLFIASGSLAEIETQLVVSNRLGYLAKSEMQPLLDGCDQISRMLGTLRKRLRVRRSQPLDPKP
jgi:four helix bundle protein